MSAVVEKKEIAEGVKVLLATSYTLFLKTQNYHWNVKGPFFSVLHELFESQYTELLSANDALAERIRALGELSPGTYKEFLEKSLIEEGNGTLSAEAMVKDILAGHQKIVEFCGALLEQASKVNDEGTVDIITSRISSHEKTIWMLKSFLGDA